jgi:bifunctional DNA-binding transcriptional regulator/antitoxin component of YhaV-PrlF toxin-antitoxin module
MSRINQGKITIPVEILDAMGWKDGTDLLVFPMLSKSEEQITSSTPILLKEIKRNPAKAKR